MSDSTPAAPTTHGPSVRDLMDARSDAIAKQRFPDANDAHGWAREGVRLNGIALLTELINGSKPNGTEPNR